MNAIMSLEKNPRAEKKAKWESEESTDYPILDENRKLLEMWEKPDRQESERLLSTGAIISLQERTSVTENEEAHIYWTTRLRALSRGSIQDMA